MVNLHLDHLDYLVSELLQIPTPAGTKNTTPAPIGPVDQPGVTFPVPTIPNLSDPSLLHVGLHLGKTVKPPPGPPPAASAQHASVTPPPPAPSTGTARKRCATTAHWTPTIPTATLCSTLRVSGHGHSPTSYNREVPEGRGNLSFDEATFSTVPRTADWLLASYNNQKPSSTFGGHMPYQFCSQACLHCPFDPLR